MRRALLLAAFILLPGIFYIQLGRSILMDNGRPTESAGVTAPAIPATPNQAGVAGSAGQGGQAAKAPQCPPDQVPPAQQPGISGQPGDLNRDPTQRTQNKHGKIAQCEPGTQPTPQAS